MEAYIGGITSVSYADWPGKRCMTIFMSGCDFKCPFCNVKNYLDFKQEHQTDLMLIKNSMLENKKFIDGVLFTGGEPSLQRQAVLILARMAKQNGLLVGIETNGAKPETLKSLMLENLVDFIAVDVKCPIGLEIEEVTKSKTFFRSTEKLLASIKDTLKYLEEIQNKVQIEIRTTIVPTLVYTKEDLLKIAEAIKYIKCTWVLQQFRNNVPLVDEKYNPIEPPSKEFLENMAEMMKKQWPGLNIAVRVQNVD